MVERFLGEHDIIVSKTDTKGIIQYGNDVFCKIADYSVGEILQKPHKLLRHPDMPSCIFKLLWNAIQSGNEIFAYVKNLTKNGDFYWVFAHVTPSFNESGDIVGYHSSRRHPTEKALNVIKPLYAELLRIEKQARSKNESIEKSLKYLEDILAQKGVTYEEFIFSL
ncbi:MAG: PAS domain-containing protein [Proteobacteria bacterium]|nr:PAS domain-containing protein [Pseudomonadota bacterium]